jgi:hypothetical protein
MSKLRTGDELRRFLADESIKTMMVFADSWKLLRYMQDELAPRVGDYLVRGGLIVDINTWTVGVSDPNWPVVRRHPVADFASKTARNHYVDSHRPKIELDFERRHQGRKLFLDSLVAAMDERARMWFRESPSEIVQDWLGLDMHPGKLSDFQDFTGVRLDAWYFLGILTRCPQHTDEFMNFVLGPFASKLKAMGLGFDERNRAFNIHGFMMLLEAFDIDCIPSGVKREFYETLLNRFNDEWARESMAGDLDGGESAARVVFFSILADVIEPTLSGPSTSEIATIVDTIMAANPDKVALARDDQRIVGWFIGQVNKASETKLDAHTVRNLILERL